MERLHKLISREGKPGMFGGRQPNAGFSLRFAYFVVNDDAEVVNRQRNTDPIMFIVFIINKIMV